MIAQLRQDEFQARLKSVQGQLDQARASLSALRLGERPEEKLRREAQLRAAEAKLPTRKRNSIATQDSSRPKLSRARITS